MKQSTVGGLVLGALATLTTTGAVLASVQSDSDSAPAAEETLAPAATVDYSTMSPEQRDQAFLTRLDQEGIEYEYTTAATTAGQVICQQIQSEMAPNGIMTPVGLRNMVAEGFNYTQDAAVALINVAHEVYCPELAIGN